MSCLLCLLPFFLTPAAASEPRLSKEEQNIVAKTNQERAKAKLPPLKANSPQLCKAAQDHARNMARQQLLSHELDGRNAGDRVKQAGYAFATWGENICRGQKNVAEAVTDWMASPRHRTNILAENYTDLGVGIAVDANKRKYYVQVFATPKP